MDKIYATSASGEQLELVESSSVDWIQTLLDN